MNIHGISIAFRVSRVFDKVGAEVYTRQCTKFVRFEAREALL